MKLEWKEETKEISCKILEYLMENPEAQDTLEGIVQWWLLEQEIKWNTAMIRKVMAELIKNNLVIEREGRDKQKHYCINQEKFEEIAEFIKAGRS